MDLGNELGKIGSSALSGLTGERNSISFKPLDVYASKLFENIKTKLRTKLESRSLDGEGNKYPIGFTPEIDYYQFPETLGNDGNPIERGNILANKRIFRDVNDILNNDIPNAYDSFNKETIVGNDGSFEFLHHLDRDMIPLNIGSDIYLTSFVETDTDNEDPISFGYDIIINYNNSPLFNGAVEDFINAYPDYIELQSRLDKVIEFKKQFFKFFKIDSPNSIPDIIQNTSPRTYYLKKIAGLDGLTENINSDKSKQFVKFGDDYITLTLNEDVSVNMGYLAVLYKTLTWSKIHGKKMIPDNLLRFDIDIVVTESRKFNRILKNGDELDEYADLISRYRYKVYECQFFFEKFSHGDSIDMWNLSNSEGFDIKFNYKFSTLNFEKFENLSSTNGDGTITRKSINVNNSKYDLNMVDPSETTNFSINDGGSIELSKHDYEMNNYYQYSSKSGSTLFTPNNEVINFFEKRLENLNKINNTTTSNLRDSLIKETLKNLNEEFGFSLSNGIGKLINLSTSGFIEDGYIHNIPAYELNKSINTVKNLFKTVANPIISNIYAQKALFQESILMNVNNGINDLTNKLQGRHIIGNIYGNSKATPIIYKGDNSPNSDPDFVKIADTGGFGKDGYQYNINAWIKNHTSIKP